MKEFPLNLFLSSLATRGITLTARDYNRLILAFQTQGKWTVARLKNVLSVILAKDSDQQSLIARQFDKYFKTETETQKNWPEIDIRLVIKQLKDVDKKTEIVKTNLTPGNNQQKISDFQTETPPKKTQQSKKSKKSKKYFPWIVAALICVAILFFIFIRFYPVSPQTNPAPVRLPGSGGITGNTATKEAKRLYPDLPYVKEIIYEPIGRSKAWQPYAAISALLFLLALLYALWLWRLAKGPFRKKIKQTDWKKQTDWSKKGPQFFHPGTIGGKVSPWLDEDTLSYLADSMGYFKSSHPGKILNIPASIKATVKQGGIPKPEFKRQKQIKSLLILEDEYAEALEWNPLAKELAQGMKRYGVPVIYGKFRSTPERFKTQDGQIYHLDELEDQRRGILLLLFTDGKVFHRPQTGFTLENLSRWPKLAWMELRNQKFWDESLHLPVKNKIPIYPATCEGLVQAVKQFMTEQGKSKKAKPDFSKNNQLISQTDAKYDAWVEYFLEDTLLWAQDCAIIQPISPGLADRLRQKFHPHLAPEQIECLYSLPNTSITDSGLRFSDQNLKALRQGFLNRRTEPEKKEVLEFLLKQIEKAKPNAPEDSLAFLSWKAVYERLKLELGADEDGLKGFGELMEGPLSNTIIDSLTNYGFADRPNKIHLICKK